MVFPLLTTACAARASRMSGADDQDPSASGVAEKPAPANANPNTKANALMRYSGGCSLVHAMPAEPGDDLPESLRGARSVGIGEAAERNTQQGDDRDDHAGHDDEQREIADTYGHVRRDVEQTFPGG